MLMMCGLSARIEGYFVESNSVEKQSILLSTFIKRPVKISVVSAQPRGQAFKNEKRTHILRKVHLLLV